MIASNASAGQLLAPSESILYARHAAEGLVPSQAVHALSILPPAKPRNVLTEMARYVTQREK